MTTTSGAPAKAMELSYRALKNETYKPRAHRSVLGEAVRNAWKDYQRKVADADEQKRVAEIIAKHIEGLVAPADLVVLRKYGITKFIDHVLVRIYDGKDWSQNASIKLQTPIETLPRNSEFSCGGQRFSRDPDRGLKPEYRASISDEEFSKIVEFQDQRERSLLPEETEPFFKNVVESRRLYNLEYAQALDWPEEFKTDTGRWPKWHEIAEMFTVLGAHLKEVWR